MAEKKLDSQPAEDSPKLVITPPVTVRDLAEIMGVRVTELMGELIKMGVMAAINDRLDLETAQKVAEKFDKAISVAEAEESTSSKSKSTVKGQPRSPVVAVMGHVDHGKTSLLDKIRKTTVADKEAGGITQHIRAHLVEYNDKKITFLDTPGHEAFSLLREHGAHLTDIALVVVAADDGLKPQTKEAIKFAKAAGVKILVALTKCDKPNLDLDRIKQALAKEGLNPEEYGGDTQVLETSAKEGTGLDKLQEMILLIADIEELSAEATGEASGTVIETHLKKGQGVEATLLVEEGSLKKSDFIVAGKVYGKVRRISNMDGKIIDSAGPSTPVVVSGWKEMPRLGQRFQVVASESLAKKLTLDVPSHERTVATKSSLKEGAIQQAVSANDTKELLILIKADVHGSLEALIKSLEQISMDEAQVKIVSQGLGDVNESDVSLAQSVGADIIGFGVGVPVKIKQLAQNRDVKLTIYTVIYELIDEVKAQLEALIEPTFKETKMAELEVKGVFKVTAGNLVCGGLVSEGKIGQGLSVKKEVTGELKEIGKVVNVQREQNDVKEVVEGQLCGLNIKTSKKTPTEIGDKLEFFKLVEQKR